MKHAKAFSVLLAALTALPGASFAQQLAAYAGYVNLRAGPARDYPIIATLPAGIDISVIGCLSDYRWCDVVAGPDRGWVYAGNIIYPYQDANVPLLTYGPVIGIGIIGFDQGRYWHRHYRARPWYRQRRDWIDRQWHEGRHLSHASPPVGLQMEQRHDHDRSRWHATAPPLGLQQPQRHVPGPELGPPPYQHQPGQPRPFQEHARGFNPHPHGNGAAHLQHK